MEIVKIGKKGQVTIPRRVLLDAGLEPDAQLIAEAEEDGSVRLRPAAVYPIEMYSDQRIAEFESENQVSDALRLRAEKSVKKKKR